MGGRHESDRTSRGLVTYTAIALVAAALVAIVVLVVATVI